MKEYILYSEKLSEILILQRYDDCVQFESPKGLSCRYSMKDIEPSKLTYGYYFIGEL